MALKLDHLCRVEHEQLAERLTRIQDDLTALTRLVRRAPFSDEVLRVQKRIQERIIDPLREASDDLSHYPSVGYGISPGRWK